MELLCLLLSAGAVYALCARVYGRLWTRRLSADLHFSTDAVVCGEQVELVEVITNDKWLPIPFVNVKLQMDRSLHFDGDASNSNVTDKAYKNDVFSLLFFQRITRRVPITCTRRGLYHIDTLELVSRGLFMNEIMSFKVGFYEELVVYPRAVDTGRLSMVYSGLCGELPVRNNDYEDPFEFRGIRDYETRDTMNMVNWKATAKTGQLKVNLKDTTANRKVCVLLDLMHEGMLVHEGLQEEGISIAAGLIQRFISDGMEVSLVTNGVDAVTGEGVSFYSGSGSAHMNSMLLGLARIDLSRDVGDLSGMLPENGNDVHYVLISSGKGRDLQLKYEKMCLEGKAKAWIMPYHEGMKGEPELCPHAQVLPWEVELR